MGESMREIKIALIGAGSMGKNLTAAYQNIPRVFYPSTPIPRLRIVSDLVEERARKFAEQFEFERWTAHWEDAVADKQVDAVTIATPNHLHRDLVLAAANNGKHIFCEKPLAQNAGEGREMYEIVHKAGVKAMVGFVYTKNPLVLMARRMIEEGELGQIYHFRARFLQDWAMSPEVPFSWRFQRKTAGPGCVSDLGSHIIQMARFLVGEFDEVCALSSTFIHERPLPEVASPSEECPKEKVDIDDATGFLARFKSGAMGAFEVTRFAAGRKIAMGFEANGSKGSIDFDHERMNEINVYFTSDPEDRQGFRTILLGPAVPYAGLWFGIPGVGLGYDALVMIELYEFLEAIVNGREAKPDFYDGWKVCQVVDAIVAAARQKRWVKVDGF